MLISSTQNSGRGKGVSRDRVTAKAKIDQKLAQGDPVQDIVDLGTSRTEAGKSEVYRDFGSSAVLHGLMGGGLGLALAGDPTVGGLVGLGLGVYVAWNKTARKNSGTVKIEMDGQTRTTRYYGKPQNYVKTPQEKRLELLSKGQLGERIRPFTLQDVNGPVSSFTADQRKALKRLDEERRLVADLGQRSEYGYEVLNQVDSLSAARLMEAGKDVFMVEGQSKDVTHTLNAEASNTRSTVRRHESDSYRERTYDYTLTALSRESLEGQPKGEGLPESFHGVYKNHRSCALIVGEDRQTGFGESGKDFRNSSFDFARLTRDRMIDMGSKDKARVVQKVAINVRDVVMVSGIAAGLLAGLHLAPGNPGVGLISTVAGGVAGRELGWLVQGKMMG